METEHGEASEALANERASQHDRPHLNHRATSRLDSTLLLGVIKFNPDAVIVTLKYGLLAVLALLIFLAINLWQSHWRRALLLVGSAFAISIVVAIIWFAIDAPKLQFNERYVATQDWSIILIGMHAVGAALLLQSAMQRFVGQVPRTEERGPEGSSHSNP